MGSGVSEGPPVPLHPLSGSSSISPLVISSRAAAAEISAAEISSADIGLGRGHWTISCMIHLKSLTVRPASSGWLATCSASAFSVAAAFSCSSASSSLLPRWVMIVRHGRGGGTSLASIFSNIRSIRIALGFIGDPRIGDPRIGNVVDDLLHTFLKLLQLLGLEARAHDAQAVAAAGPDLTVERTVRHRTDRLR